MCQQDGTCPGLFPRFSVLYFAPLFHVSERWYDFVATTDGHGTWHQSSERRQRRHHRLRFPLPSLGH
jgi:hypothetical protein